MINQSLIRKISQTSFSFITNKILTGCGTGAETLFSPSTTTSEYLICDRKEKNKKDIILISIGFVIWLQITIRPNLLFTVNLLSQFAANPRKTYSEVIKYTLAYIKKTIKYKITYYNDTSLQLVSFVNSNYTNDCNM